MTTEKLMGVLWPAFLAACLMELLVFALVDPQSLHGLGQDLALPRQAVYSLAFFVFWIVTCFSSGLTALLMSKPTRTGGGFNGSSENSQSV
jgi:hypothetical protein